MDGNDAQVPADLDTGRKVDVHAPFTLEERFQQLSQIDHDVTAILEHTGNAIQSLAKPQDASRDSNSGSSAASEPATAAFDPQARLTTFKDAMDTVMVMLHSVDTRLKRQIYGLEEAGIITLPSAAQRAEAGRDAATSTGGGAGFGGSGAAGGAGGGPGGPGGAPGAGASATTGTVKASLQPNGEGRIGNLDVGILNANSSTVERDMESELWTSLREHLDKVVADAGSDEEKMIE